MNITLNQIEKLFRKNIEPLEKKIEALDDRIGAIDDRLKRLDRRVEDLESDSRTGRERLERRMKDLESDNRTDKALLRAAQQMGFGFHEKTPYELQGNAAIEDIKEYY